MHRVVQDQIERIVARQQGGASCTIRYSAGDAMAAAHLAECEECGQEVRALQEQAAAFRQLGLPQTFELEPRAGFYARVLERIEAEGPVSIWNLFMESPFGKRIAVASLSLAVVLGVYLVTSEHSADDPIVAAAAEQRMFTVPPASEDDPFAGMQSELLGNQFHQLPVRSAVTTIGAPADDAVLSNLMTYREQ